MKSVLLDELKAMKQRVDALFSENVEGKTSDRPDEMQVVYKWQPLVDVMETAENWILIADVPGVLDEDLEVELVENQLTIRGRREAFPDLEGSWVPQSERADGQFSRTLVLPHGIQRETIQAQLKRGVLTVTVPKDQSFEPSSHRIEIKSG